ncbi:DUF91 domain-containing protein [Mangrovicoccus sp. HB182678]|uniref:DUF91 domain-containing protein n=2 Tax=Mangrovicoccus algicola TaxID=2771008 RepID=A0A8J6YUP0_9RHOB|nr:DUF91 domain-containing protein [Mangrovicoccus algicola]
MDQAGFRQWLETSYEHLAKRTIDTYISDLRRVVKEYGPIEGIVSDGGLENLRRELSYSAADERANRPNPSRLAINGSLSKTLPAYRKAVDLFAKYINETAGSTEIAAAAMSERLDDGPWPEPSATVDKKQRLALERDLQKALRRQIGALESGLAIADDGTEHSVPSGFIDILCRDNAGTLVVVELKAGTTDPRVVAQTLGYMGDLMDDNPDTPVRGIIVAHDFDKRTRSAAKAVPNLRLVRYAISFDFEPA